MRTMYDGITPTEVPPGGQLYAGYVDGNWPSYPGLVARFPAVVHVPIAVSASTDAGTVLDVEQGDASPAQAVDWVLMRRRAGVDPSVYCSLSAWPAVRAAFAARGVTEPHYWVADYSPSTVIPEGAVALQHTNTAGYDVSAVVDYWPGVDPAPAATSQEDDMPAFQTGEIRPGWFTDAHGTTTVDAATMLTVPPPGGGALGWGSAWLSVSCDFRDVELRVAVKVEGQAWALHSLKPTAAGERVYLQLPTATQKISIGRIAQSTSDDPATPCAWLLEYGA